MRDIYASSQSASDSIPAAQTPYGSGVIRDESNKV